MTGSLLPAIRTALCVCIAMALSIHALAAAPRHTLYVSALGANTDGKSWQAAFHSIQSALSAVPDGDGGCRIVIRPDTYFEANLSPAFRGKQGAYNEIVGDTDGKMGSGTVGDVIIDSGDPGQKGFKSYDWWSTIRATTQGWSKDHKEKTFSAIGWDRWALRRLYSTGSDAGIFFDMTDHVEPFSIIIEDCTSIGRAFGGGVASCLSRPDEPVTFRRCHLWALDFWGDTSGAYIRFENKTMPASPDAVFEDCTLVGPQCALKSSNFGFHTFSRIRLKGCRLAALNFSQPVGTPTDGIIQSVQEGKLLHVELENTILMGYKVLGVIKQKDTVKDIGVTVTGDVRAYVQFQQTTPPGIYQQGGWPAELFRSLVPPAPLQTAVFTAKEDVRNDLCEVTPFVWKGKLWTMECVRPASGGTAADYHLALRDVAADKIVATCAEGYGLGALMVDRGELIISASRWEANGWHDVTLFRSKDMKRWTKTVAVQGENEQLFNSSVCKGADGYVMAYESNDPAYPPFTVKFAHSTDLKMWNKLPAATFGTDRYTACPCVRYANGYYYVLYLEHRKPRWWFETYITRSPDLKHWELSSANPVLRPEMMLEGINASDPDLVEWKGKTYLYYAVGDQLSWMNVRRAVFNGSLSAFLESWYKTPGIKDAGSTSYQIGSEPEPAQNAPEPEF